MAFLVHSSILSQYFEQNQIAKNKALLDQLGITRIAKELRHEPKTSSMAGSGTQGQRDHRQKQSGSLARHKRGRRRRSRDHSESSRSKSDSSSSSMGESVESAQESSQEPDGSLESESEESAVKNEAHSGNGPASLNIQGHCQSGLADATVVFESQNLPIAPGQSEVETALRKKFDNVRVDVEADLRVLDQDVLMRFLESESGSHPKSHSKQSTSNRSVLQKRSKPQSLQVYF